MSASAIHPAAARGFQSAADAYERGRPDYPPEAISWLVEKLGIRPGVTVLDLGAGTGKLTRLLAPGGARLLAVEPVAAMREKFSELLPGIPARDGSAESIPLADGSAQAVVAAQAFHWFRGPEALREIHRVLSPGGRLGLVWNVRDESVDWVAKLTEIIAPYEQGAPRYRSGEWRRAFAEENLFTPLEEASFRYVQTGDAATLVDRIASISFVAALPEHDRARVLEQVREMLSTHPETVGKKELGIPYRTDVFWCERK